MARRAQQYSTKTYRQSAYQPPQMVEIRVRDRPGILTTLFNLSIALVILAVVIVVLLTGLGAVIVHLGTTGGLPGSVVEVSTNLYHSFFP